MPSSGVRPCCSNRMRTNVEGTTKVVHGCQKNGGQDFPFPAAVLMRFCRLWAAKKMGGPPNHVLSRRQSFQSVAAPVFLTERGHLRLDLLHLSH